MEALYDLQAPKKPTNLSINSDLLNRACSLNINLSSTLETALKQLLAEQRAEQWKVANRSAIQIDDIKWKQVTDSQTTLKTPS